MAFASPMRWFLCCAALALVLASCDGAAHDAAVALTREQLLDPATCKGCHPTHYREWSSSMHAYASKDPVFLAMNKRGQEEAAELGDFCVKCHAPMAVREKATSDGLNLEQVPDHLQGVTCYFCHNAVGIEKHFNNDIQLADDTTMRGGIRDPVRTEAHRAEYSELHDRNSQRSTLLCGGCHDIVTPKGVELERTLQEYEGSVFAKPGAGFDTCQGCHMRGREGVVANDPATPVPLRRLHEHLWPGVDVALTEFPHREAQRIAIDCALAYSISLITLDHDGQGRFTVQLETNAGHGQPSGAAQDRRMWLELIAYDAQDEVIYESGAIADGEVEEKPIGAPDYDRNLWLFRDRIYGNEDEEVHMFWDATRYQNYTLPPAVTVTRHTLTTHYDIPPARVARVTARLRMRPMGLDVLQDLIDSGHLDPALVEQMPTFTVAGAVLEWKRGDTPRGTVTQLPISLQCPNDYLCMLEPDSDFCDH
jgi:hypothetical protein